MFLRKHFHRFGPIQDVVVKEYINNVSYNIIHGSNNMSIISFGDAFLVL